MVEKLVVVIMGQNCQRFIGMCLESVKDADVIVYCDGGSTDNTLQIVDTELSGNNLNSIIENTYNKKDKQMNAKQRNFYLNYIKENYPNDWCLCLDADEVVHDLRGIKDFIQVAKPGLYAPKMRHLMDYLNYEDALTPDHWAMNRLFKISEVRDYPLGEHPVLQPKVDQPMTGTDCTTIWHLGYISGVFDFKKKYQNHLEKSEMHTKEYLDRWYFNHIFNLFPKKQFNPLELPDIILDEFLMDRDKLYFQGRENFEVKHYQDAINWKEFFNPASCLIFGCAMGQRVYTLNKLGVDTYGIELSEYAVEQRLHKNVIQGDIVSTVTEEKRDLVVAYDVLEHLKYEDLDKAIDNMIKSSSRYILISVPVLGNPALEYDPTHLIKESEEWWIKRFTKKGLKLIKTPDHFVYKEQVYIFEK